MTNADSRGTGESWASESHDEFLQLCALSTSGQLTRAEQVRLDAHIADCADCRAAMRDFEVVVTEVIPAMVAEHAQSDPESDSSWLLEKAEERLFKEIARQRRADASQIRDFGDLSDFRHRVPVGYSGTWRHIWMLSAAAILLTIALGFSAYEFVIQRELSASTLKSQSEERFRVVLERRLHIAIQEYKAAQVEVAQKDTLLTELKYRLQQRSAEIDYLRANQQRLGADLHDQNLAQQKLAKDRDNLSQQLGAAEDQRDAVLTELASAEEEKFQAADNVTALEGKLNDLRNLIKDREETIEEQREMLAHDRDIRELMGARDLYVAEVYDIAATGKTQTPFGRVFYTRGKSLVFYAYDLDRQIDLRKARTFQVWGRTGRDNTQALRLGIFYEDNAAKKRWVMRSNDPKALADIDAVFVTVEPKAGSAKPSGTPLLFAYLRVDPNHP